LNIHKLKAAEEDSVNVTPTIFFERVLEAHQKLAKERKGNPFVPIPEIEREVCSQFVDEEFTTFDFRQRLSDLKGKKVKGYTLVFSKPGFRKANGLRIKGEYYYYMAIFSR